MTTETATAYDIEVFFDGGCPLCRREINMLRRKDRHQRIRFTDIDSPEFQDATLGVTRDQLMAEIHGRLSDGTLIKGVEVFRRLYSAVGFGPIISITRWPVISSMLDLGYWVFAKNRLKLTGRCSATSCPIPNSKQS